MSKLVDIETIRQFVNERRLRNEMAETSLGDERAEEDYALLKFLDTLPEEKPVDLEKEIVRWWSEYYNGRNEFYKSWSHMMPNSTILDMVRYFFNLGRMAKKD